MQDVPGTGQSFEVEQVRGDRGLTFLVELPSRRRVFFGNLRDLLIPSRLPELRLQSAPAPFWPDVWVERSLPSRRFLESGGYHILAIALLISASRFLDLHSKPEPHSTFDSTQVIYYDAAEFLPPLDTRSPAADPPQKADPEFSRQPIISVPREADNRLQTIVTPPNVRLKGEVPLPNIVAWSENAQLPIAPSPLIPASSIARLTPQVENSIIAPAPEVRTLSPGATLQAPQPAVMGPPPTVDNASTRPPGDLNIGQSAVIAPAPQLPVGTQRAIGGAVPSAAGISPRVVPPPPSIAAGGPQRGERMIALNLHPTVSAPTALPQGNRRGSFAATPERHSGASGAPGTAAGTGRGKTDGGATKKRIGDPPSGLYVGNVNNSGKSSAVEGDAAARSTAANTVNPNLIASARPPRISGNPGRLQAESETKLSETERQVFGTRKFYSLMLNMPNLNSAGGSWVIRFAELKESAGTNSGELSAPAATRKVDPAYPLELMRQNVAGTVILYAVIHADGRIGDVRVLRSVDDRIDEFARQALSQWQFQPATRNGMPVDVEATFHIPFHPLRSSY
jgi:TonB family protein